LWHDQGAVLLILAWLGVAAQKPMEIPVQIDISLPTRASAIHAAAINQMFWNTAR
jgi:hypothetical protein